MAQNQTQMYLLIGLLLIVSVYILMWLANNNRLQCSPEGYMPYRNTGNCPPRTGYNYLDAYEQSDYYKKYPYVYPTPPSYTRNIFKYRRQWEDAIAKKIRNMGLEYARTHNYTQ